MFTLQQWCRMMLLNIILYTLTLENYAKRFSANASKGATCAQ